jgi:hypothetical protein
VKQGELNGDPKFTVTIGLGGKLQVIERKTKDNFENGKEYARLT